MQVLYPINEIFSTIQGEGSFSGTPSIFIRLQGCDVGCGWCDTKHTWALDTNHHKTFAVICAKTDNNQSWANVTLDELTDFIQQNYPTIRHVVITGGEPGQYDLQPLCIKLEKLGKNIQIETSGTNELLVSVNTWVTLSPKIDMPGNKVIVASAVKRANEIKMPIGKISDIRKLEQFIIDYQPEPHLAIWLQPISQNKTATKLCIEYALKNNWRLSIQLHKYLDIR